MPTRPVRTSNRSLPRPWRRLAWPSGSAYLDGACDDDADLRSGVERLLQAHDQAGVSGQAGAGAGDPDATAGAPGDVRDPYARDRPASRPFHEGPGSRIGPYKLLQEIGEGGMGVVYMAEQEKPVRRRVALKIIKPGMDTEPGRRPVRGRAPGAGADGPPQHRQGLRRRHHRHRAGPTSSWSWSRASRSPSTATRTSSLPRSGSSCSSRSARRSSTPIRKGSSTATSSRRTCW